MFGIFDFKDALNNLFHQKKSVFQADIASLKGSKVVIDETNLTFAFTKHVGDPAQSLNLPYQTFVEKYCKTLKDAGIDFSIVFTGNAHTNDYRYRASTHSACRVFWKCHYFKIIHQKIQNEEIREAKTMNNNFVFGCIFTDYLVSAQFDRFFEIFHYNFLRRIGADFMRAPKHKENQILWLSDNGFVNAIASSPFMFIFQNVNQIISDFDFKIKIFRYYDIQHFSKSFNISVEQMRELLFLLLCSFIMRIEKGEKLKLDKALSENHSKIVEVFQEESSKNIDFLSNFIIRFSEVLTKNKENKESSFSEAMKLLDLSKKNVDEIRLELFSAQIVSDSGEILCYPGKKPLLGRNYCFGVSLKDIVILYSLHLLSDSILFLLSPNLRNMYVFPATILQNFETIKLKCTYVKRNLEKSLFKMLSLFNFEFNEHYILVPCVHIWQTLRTDFLYQTTTVLWEKITNTQNLALISEIESQKNAETSEIVTKVSKNEFLKSEFISIFSEKNEKPFSLFESLRFLDENVEKKAQNVVFSSQTLLSVSEFSLSVNLNFLQEMGFVDIKKPIINCVGKALLKCFDAEFFEQAIILLEFIRIDTFGKQSEDSIMDPYNDFHDPEAVKKHSLFKNTPQMQKPLIDSRAKSSSKTDLNTTLQINLLESKVCVLDRELDSIRIKIENLENGPILIESITNMVKNKYRRQIELISKFFVLSWSNLSVKGLSDYESCLFFEKLNLVLLSLFNTTSTNAALLFFKTATKSNVKIVTDSFPRFPFINVYSLDLGILSKKLLTKFLAYKELEPCKVEYANKLRKELTFQKINSLHFLIAGFDDILKKALKFYKSMLRLMNLIFEDKKLVKTCAFYQDIVESESIFLEFAKFVESGCLRSL